MVGNTGTAGSSIVQNLRSKLSTDGVKVAFSETASEGLDCEMAPHTTQLRSVSNADG